MSDMVKRLRDRRQNVWSECRALAERATEENRAFTAEEQGQWDALNGELDNLDRRIKSALDTEKRAKEADDTFNQLYRQEPVRGAGQVPQSKQQVELRAFLRGEQGAPRFYDVPRPEGPQEFRATLVKGTASAGGATVPTTFYDRLVAHLIEVSGIMQAGVTVLNTSSGENITVPKTLTHGQASLTGEGGALSANDPTFGTVTLGAYKYGELIQVARELVDDTGVDLEGYLAMMAGRALGNAIGTDLVVGDGSSKPRGVLAATSGATTGVTGPSGVSGGLGATSPTANTGGDLLIDLFYSVIAPYRASRSCAWIARDATMAVLRKIKDTTGQYIFQPALVAGTPDTLLGKPIYSDPFVPAMATGAKSIVFGDFSQYFVRLAGGVRFERSDDFAFGTDLVTFRAILRGDGALVDLTGAVKCFAGNAA